MIQTAWAELVVATLADAGVRICVVSPGSRSTPLVAAIAEESRLVAPIVIDERAAAFAALGAARGSGEPVALVCTSGTAGAHYLPALVEASHAGVPLVAITCDRPPEAWGAGSPQTIDQVKLFGDVVRAYIDLGPPDGADAALRAVRRKVAQAVSCARGPHPGPVHVEVPLRKPLEPVAIAYEPARRLRAQPLVVAPPPRALADAGAVAALAAALAGASRPLVVAGAAPIDREARRAVLALAARAGAPVLAEAGSQLRFGPGPDRALRVGGFDVILATRARCELVPDLLVRVGAEPAAAAWPAAREAWREVPRWALGGHGWVDPDSSAAGVVRGELADAADRVAERLPVGSANAAWLAAWADADAAARAALAATIEAHPDGEPAVMRAAIAAAPAEAIVLLGNSLPVRVADHALPPGGPARDVITQRGACGIDGLVAGALGATWTGRPVVAVIGDVAFAHDLGAVAAAARAATAPLALVVIDNGGGRIFDGLPAATVLAPQVIEAYFHTAPGLDPAAIARAVGARAITATSPAAAAAAVAAASTAPGLTVIHAPVSIDGAHVVRRTAIATLSRAAEASAARGAVP